MPVGLLCEDLLRAVVISRLVASVPVAFVVVVVQFPRGVFVLISAIPVVSPQSLGMMSIFRGNVLVLIFTAPVAVDVVAKLG